ncbi:MAG TPA: hypothetical protein PKH79_12020 [Prolixibacteraceae bacterium]|nr:hypothetical protein [Prolixibacteraceae bacterium]HPS12053.1 hypothetical protein [Prolixibacteraceae bacterium]
MKKLEKMEEMKKKNCNFKIEESIPRNLLNVYLSFISIISVCKEVNLRDIQSDIESQEIEYHKFSEWFSWN